MAITVGRNRSSPCSEILSCVTDCSCWYKKFASNWGVFIRILNFDQMYDVCELYRVTYKNTHTNRHTSVDAPPPHTHTHTYIRTHDCMGVNMYTHMHAVLNTYGALGKPQLGGPVGGGPLANTHFAHWIKRLCMYMQHAQRQYTHSHAYTYIRTSIVILSIPCGVDQPSLTPRWAGL